MFNNNEHTVYHCFYRYSRYKLIYSGHLIYSCHHSSANSPEISRKKLRIDKDRTLSLWNEYCNNIINNSYCNYCSKHLIPSQLSTIPTYYTWFRGRYTFITNYFTCVDTHIVIYNNANGTVNCYYYCYHNNIMFISDDIS